MPNIRALGLAGRPRDRPAIPPDQNRTRVPLYPANHPGQDRAAAPLYDAALPAELMASGPRVEPRLDITGTLRYGGARAPDAITSAAWLLIQTECFLSAGFVSAGVGLARPGHHALGLSGPDGRLITAHQTHVGDWEVAVQHGATAAAPRTSPARGQARWIGGIAWHNNYAGAQAVAQCAARLGFLGPQVREERSWLFSARWRTPDHGGGGGPSRAGNDTA